MGCGASTEQQFVVQSLDKKTHDIKKPSEKVKFADPVVETDFEKKEPPKGFQFVQYKNLKIS